MLVDTNTLLRTLQLRSPQHQIARNAIKTLTAQGDELFIVPQNLVELWVVATRPEAYNGLGLSVEQVAAELARLKNLFSFLPDTAAIHPMWESLVKQHRVSGKLAHDARACGGYASARHHVHSYVNVSDFRRYPGIRVVDPAEIA